MRENALPPTYIVALNRETEADDIRVLRRCGVTDERPGTGAYKGKHERAYLLSAAQFEKLRPHLVYYGQESVLFLDNQRNAFLYFKDDDYRHGASTVYVGEFREVSNTQAARLDNWCKFGGTYYAAR